MSSSAYYRGVAVALDESAQQLVGRAATITDDADVVRLSLDGVLAATSAPRLDHDVTAALGYVVHIDTIAAQMTALATSCSTFAEEIRALATAAGGDEFMIQLHAPRQADSVDASERVAAARGSLDTRYDQFVDSTVTAWVSSTNRVAEPLREALAATAGGFSPAVVVGGGDGVAAALLRQAGIDPSGLLTTLPPGEFAAVTAELDAAAAAVLAGDGEAVAELEALLAEHGDDPAVMSAFLEHLGPMGYVDLTDELFVAEGSDGVEAVDASAAALFDGLEFVQGSDSFTPAALAEAAFSPTAADGDTRWLDQPDVYYFYLAASPFLGAAFERRVLELEIEYATEHGPRQLWGYALVEQPVAPSFLEGPRHRGVNELIQGERGGEPINAIDILLLDVAADADEVQQLYADPEVLRYLTAEHPFTDGYTSLFVSVDVAATSGDPALGRRIFDGFVIGLDDRPGFRTQNVSVVGSVAASHLVDVYLQPITDNRLALTDDVPFGDYLAEVGSDGAYESVGLDGDGITLLARSAANSPAGVDNLARTRHDFVVTAAADAAAHAAEQQAAGVDPGLDFEVAIRDAAWVDQLLGGAVGDQAVLNGRDRDAATNAWRRSIEYLVNSPLRVVTGVASSQYELPLNPASLLPSLDLGVAIDATDGAVNDGERAAGDAVDQIGAEFAVAAADAGLVDGFPTTMPEYLELTPGQRVEYWKQFDGTAIDRPNLMANEAVGDTNQTLSGGTPSDGGLDVDDTDDDTERGNEDELH